MKANFKTNILIAIITCKRPIGLSRLLRELQKQELDSIEVEILVVDNACQPEIKKIVDAIDLESQIKIKYLQESKAGIVAARNKCTNYFLSKKFDALAFIDDDEWPHTNNWLKLLNEAMKKYNVNIVTSHIISVGEDGTPEWALKLLYGPVQMKEGQRVSYFYTGNLLIDRKVIEHFPVTFDERFALTGASDYHFSLRCTNAGFHACYTKSPVIEEFPKSRASVRWFLKRGFRSGVGYTRSHMFEDSFLIGICKCLFMSLARLTLGIIKCIKSLLTFNKVTFIDGLFKLSSAAGTIAGLIGIKHNEYKKIHGG